MIGTIALIIFKVQSEYFPELKCEKFQFEGPTCVGI